MLKKPQKPKKHLVHIVSILTLSCLFVGEAWAKKLTLIFNEEKSLPIKVAKNGAVRLSVKGDRLQDVMGLTESVNFEKDETHGFLYLRGIDHTQTITVITEGGILQDLTLEPDDHDLSMGVSNVVLKSKEESEEGNLLQRTSFDNSQKFHSVNSLQPSPFPNNSFQDAIIMLMKQLHRGMGSSEELQSIAPRQTFNHVSAQPLRQMKVPGMVGVVFEIVNETGTTLNLLEKDFYRVGDCALAIGKKQLEKDEKTLLLIVQQG